MCTASHLFGVKIVSDYECPKCGAGHEATGSHEDDTGERECDECGFAFIVEVEYEPEYSTSCVTHDYVFERCGNTCSGNRCQLCGTIDISSLVEDGKTD